MLGGADGCEDMRVTFDGFVVDAKGNNAALVVKPEPNDEDSKYYTGVFIRNNTLRSYQNPLAAVQLGTKAADHTLYWQSVSWGEVTNNIIINEEGYLADGITAHHFVAHSPTTASQALRKASMSAWECSNHGMMIHRLMTRITSRP